MPTVAKRESVVFIRLLAEQRERLGEVVKYTGRSISDLVREFVMRGVGEIEAEIRERKRQKEEEDADRFIAKPSRHKRTAKGLGSGFSPIDLKVFSPIMTG